MSLYFFSSFPFLLLFFFIFFCFILCVCYSYIHKFSTSLFFFYFFLIVKTCIHAYILNTQTILFFIHINEFHGDVMLEKSRAEFALLLTVKFSASVSEGRHKTR
jgi:hypothetical protein